MVRKVCNAMPLPFRWRHGFGRFHWLCCNGTRAMFIRDDVLDTNDRIIEFGMPKVHNRFVIVLVAVGLTCAHLHPRGFMHHAKHWAYRRLRAGHAVPCRAKPGLLHWPLNADDIKLFLKNNLVQYTPPRLIMLLFSRVGG